MDAYQIEKSERMCEDYMRLFDGHFRIYQYRRKRENKAIPRREDEDPVVDEEVS